ncbi:MAG: glutathione S-transferase family protein [Candidatus Binatia bacterium]
MQLYSGPLSLFTAKVRIALDEKALPYDLISVPFSRAGYTPKHPEVVRINPKAQVPVLVDGDAALYDSSLILEYLEERYPDPPLYPRNLALRVRCRQLEAAADEILFPSVWELIQEVFYKPDAAQRDAARVAAAQTAIAAHYARLDGELAGREFLCGAFSVADIAYFMTMLFAGSLGAPPAEAHANVIAWSGRVGARPAVQREVEGITAAARSLQ